MSRKWDGKCAFCGVQIEGNPDEELHYDMGDIGVPAYCNECWNKRNKEEMNRFYKYCCIAITLIIVFFVLSRIMGGLK